MIFITSFNEVCAMTLLIYCLIFLFDAVVIAYTVHKAIIWWKQTGRTQYQMFYDEEVNGKVRSPQIAMQSDAENKTITYANYLEPQPESEKGITVSIDNRFLFYYILNKQDSGLIEAPNYFAVSEAKEDKKNKGNASEDYARPFWDNDAQFSETLKSMRKTYYSDMSFNNSDILRSQKRQKTY